MKTGRPRKFASSTPVLVRVPDDLLAELDSWVAEIREAGIGTSTVSRSDVIRDVLKRAVEQRRAASPKPAKGSAPTRKKTR